MLFYDAKRDSTSQQAPEISSVGMGMETIWAT